jgi:hypothetical protein
MIEVTMLASSVVALLAPFVKKASEAVANEVGKSIYAKLGKMFTSVKESVTGDPAAADALQRFQANPERYQPMLEDILGEKIRGSDELRSSLSALVQEIKAEGPNLRIVMNLKAVEEAIGLIAGEVKAGDIQVEQTAEDAKRVVGAKIDRLG